MTKSAGGKYRRLIILAYPLCIHTKLLSAMISAQETKFFIVIQHKKAYVSAENCELLDKNNKLAVFFRWGVLDNRRILL